MLQLHDLWKHMHVAPTLREYGNNVDDAVVRLPHVTKIAWKPSGRGWN